jgi:atypical dual specificity phosphatase
MEALNWLMDYLYEWSKYNYYVGTVFGKYMSYMFIHGNWWNRVDSHLILGAIPLHNANHLELLVAQEQVGAILCILEEFETKPSIYFCPVAKEEWEANHVAYLRVSAADCYGVQLPEIQKGVDFINDQITNGRTVYVHCKAGKGRSASMVLCYLLRHQFETTGQQLTNSDFTTIYDQLRSIRGEIFINEWQMKTVRQYLELEDRLAPLPLSLSPSIPTSPTTPDYLRY